MLGIRVDLGPASYLEVSPRCPSIHTYSHTQQFPRIFCVNPEFVRADGGFLGPQCAQSGPDPSAQSVGRVARLSGDVRQPNHVLANEIAGHKAERRPGAGEEWRAATKHEGAEIESILIN